MALLEDDVAVAAVIQRMALEQATAEKWILDKNGRPHYALNSWMKFAGIKKSALLALKKFQQSESAKSEEPTLADVVLEVSEDPGE